ncbi:MAG: STAS domain-containing protein [Dissulfurispiraceae bacterium]|nr:STAS domain-containing protein [Dissulfurispiraceae bacterium]
MEMEINNSGDVCIMNLKGDVLIDDIDMLRTRMIEALESSDRIVLNVENVTVMDFFSLQFLCSAHRTSAGLNKHFELTGKKSDALRDIVKQSGFKREIGCIYDKFKKCFWVNED